MVFHPNQLSATHRDTLTYRDKSLWFFHKEVHLYKPCIFGLAVIIPTDKGAHTVSTANKIDEFTLHMNTVN